MLSGLQNPRQAAAQLMNFGLILSTAFMVRPPLPQQPLFVAHLLICDSQMWKGLSVITDSPSPIVVVLSGSMEPAFQRGDLLLLWNRNFLSETSVGEIVVYNVKDKDIPIVHRVVRKFGTGSVNLSRSPSRLVPPNRCPQAGRKAPHQGRQQPFRRYRALRQRARLPGQERHYWVRGIASQLESSVAN